MRFPSTDHKKAMAMTDASIEEDKRLAAEIQDGTIDFDDDEEMD